MDADFADDLALLMNTPAQAESLLQSLQQAVGEISLYSNANKTEKQKEPSPLKVSSLYN